METRTSCQDCIYRRPITPLRPGQPVCHYLLDTGTPRGCPADHCTRRRVVPRRVEDWLVVLRRLHCVEEEGCPHEPA